MTLPHSSIECNSGTMDGRSLIYNPIKELLDSEFCFRRDMRVVGNLYKARSNLSADDIRIIFRNSDEVAQISMEFQADLKYATRMVYVRPRASIFSLVN